MSEQIEASSKKVRGRSKRTLTLIGAMRKIAEETHPITGRGIGYKLFAAGLITGMDQMNMVYRALKVAREDGTIPWDLAGEIRHSALTVSSTAAIYGRRNPILWSAGARRVRFGACCGRS